MLLDTSGLLCYLHFDEPKHQEAVQFLDNYDGKLLTHNYVLAELVALAIARRFPRSPVLDFLSDLLNDPNIETVWVNENLHKQAMKLLLNRADKTYSLCDAVSFVLMKQRKITRALTTDRHVQQEGFIQLL